MFAGFSDRSEAGKFLAEQLSTYAGRDDVVVLALPRGGVPVGYEVAQSLEAPLDVFVVRKLGVPGHEEFGFGAIASGGSRFINLEIVRALRMTEEMVERVISREAAELARRELRYRGDRPPHVLTGKRVIVVDDGLATGATMNAAVEAIKQQQPKEIIVAVPVGSEQTCSDFEEKADVVCVCAVTPEPFYAVGLWYRDFRQTSDEEVCELLERARTVKGELAAAR